RKHPSLARLVAAILNGFRRIGANAQYLRSACSGCSRTIAERKNRPWRIAAHLARNLFGGQPLRSVRKPARLISQLTGQYQHALFRRGISLAQVRFSSAVTNLGSEIKLSHSILLSPCPHAVLSGLCV